MVRLFTWQLVLPRVSVPRDPRGSFKASFDFKSKGLHKVVKGVVHYVGWVGSLVTSYHMKGSGICS